MHLTSSLFASLLASVGVPCAAALPSQMKAVQASGTPCEKPDWTCISEKTVEVPRPGAGQMLVAMKGASVNQCNGTIGYNGTIGSIGCIGTIGNDGSGVVVEMGEDACDGFAVGDEVWMWGGQYAEYAVVPCATAGLKPKKLSFVDAGTIPVVGATSLQCLQATGAPLTNLTVVVTSGQGGTGFMGVQLAKALGASRVVTAATGEGITLMKKLGADTVIDYHKQDLFDALDDDSVDVVFDNFGLPGTADKAMHAIRSGGVFMILFGGNAGKPSDHPKSGVRQVPSCRTKEMGKEELDTLASLFDAGKLQPHTMSPVYGLSEVPQAFTRLLSHGVLGKIAIVPTSATQEDVLKISAKGPGQPGRMVGPHVCEPHQTSNCTCTRGGSMYRVVTPLHTDTCESFCTPLGPDGWHAGTPQFPDSEVDYGSCVSAGWTQFDHAQSYPGMYSLANFTTDVYKKGGNIAPTSGRVEYV